MYTPCYSEKTYELSRRHYDNDYFKIEKKDIDMTLSGTYLGEYPKFNYENVIFDKYPSKDIIKELETKIIKKCSIEGKEVIIGAGSNGIIQNIAKLLLNKGGNLVTTYLTFDQIEYAATSYDAVTKRAFLNPDYSISLANIEKCIDCATKLVYLCNPNNPTGIYIDSKEILKFALRNKHINILVDESSIEYSGKESLLAYDIPKNLLVLRSFSKAYGLAGLRIGYLVCSKEFREVYEHNITENEVSIFAYISAREVLESDNYLKNILETNKEKNRLITTLESKNIKVLDSSSNIIMTDTKFNDEILNVFSANDISIVPIYDNQKELHLRIAVQDKITNDKFINKVKGIIEEKYII